MICSLPVVVVYTSAGFIVSSSQIPLLLRWFKYISFHRLTYQILISLEFSDRSFDCPYKVLAANGLDELPDPSKCASWNGNTILQSEFEGLVRFFPGPIALLLIHFCVYTVAAWAVLLARPVDQVYEAANGSPIEHAFRVLMSLIYSERRHITKASLSNKRTLDESKLPAGEAHYAMTELDELRFDALDDNKHQGQTPSVAIRVENLSLSLVRSNWAGYISGWWPETRRSQAMQKPLLQDISLEIPPAQLTAILGGSGSGKTTLLNTLLNRNYSNMHVSGNLYFNGIKNPTMAQTNAMCGYVRQDNGFLMPHLTVRETLRYAAELGMSRSLSKAEKWVKVEEIVDVLGLRGCADVMIGGYGTMGCSGGQKRRVSIGMQMVTDPACLFLDEPTSGLDALTGDIWDEFDNVILLMEGGRPAFAGKATEAVNFFERAGHVMPKHTNPPVDTISVNSRSAELYASSRATTDALFALYREESEKEIQQTMDGASFLISQNQIQTPGRARASLSSSISILTRRSFKNAIRQPGSYLNRILQPVLIVLLTVIFFWRLESTSVGLLNRLGLFHQLMGATLAGLMVHIEVFPRERDIAFREVSDGRYDATAFLVSYMINELPLSLLSACLSAGIIFQVTGLQTNVKSVSSMVLVMFAYITTGESLGIAYSSWFVSNGGLGVAFMNSTVLWMSFMAGFLTPKLPWILCQMNFASIFRYSARVLSLNEFRGLAMMTVSTSASASASIVPSDIGLISNASLTQTPPSSTPFQKGEAVLEFLDFADQSLERCIGIVFGLMMLYRVMAWGTLVARARSLCSR
ncbi:ATP-binding cassette sub- G member 5 [Gamsiella multidivaricata]|nr:ATP-binding cassette sub- G member 5 [Gamsiella multidivaricata]